MALLLDPDTTRIADANAPTSAFFGQPIDSLRGLPLAALCQDNARDKIEASVARATEDGTATFILEQMLACGMPSMVRFHATMMSTECGAHLFCTLEDVTQQTQDAKALASGKELFRALIEHSLDILFVIDLEGEIAFASPSVERILGYHYEELLGVRADSLLHPEDAKRLSARWESLVGESGKVTEFKHRIRCKDGAYRVLASRIRNHATHPMLEGFVVNARDITSEEKMSEKLRTHATRLEANNRELKEFAYVASHDLQEPLRKIRAFGDRLERQFGETLGERGLDYLGRMNVAATRMSTLIEDLLEYSRLTTQQRPFRRLELHEILEGVLTDLEIAIRDQRATFDIGDLHALDADPTMLRQLLQNLISNAIKFSSPEQAPHVSIQTDERETPDGSVQIELTVTDNGIGFDQKYAKNIFQPFQRLHGRNNYKGTGIGLAICRKIVEHHGGLIHAFSAPGDGATFVVLLPRDHDPNATCEQEPIP
jgi:PAS domain S-box-containing protein